MSIKPPQKTPLIDIQIPVLKYLRAALGDKNNEIYSNVYSFTTKLLIHMNNNNLTTSINGIINEMNYLKNLQYFDPEQNENNILLIKCLDALVATSVYTLFKLKVDKNDPRLDKVKKLVEKKWEFL